MMLRDAIVSWNQQNGARSFDIEFADWLYKHGGEQSESLWFAIWCLSYQSSQGHVCIDLRQPIDASLLPDSVRAQLPSFDGLQQQLLKSTLTGAPADSTPLVLLDGHKLYLRRFFALESRLASDIAARKNYAGDHATDATSRKQVADVVARLFADRGASDWQQVACANAIINRFSIIAGGPGTGKTTTVVRLLAALCELEQLDAEAIRLVAPTGKAAMRLSQSVRDNRNRLHDQAGLGGTVPDAASTIHRLLRFSNRTQSFHFNRSNPLPLRVVIIDEASMIDVSLMMALLDAIPRDARVILLGDQFQLASVEEGSVLAELCGDLSRHGYSPAHRKLLGEIVALPADAATADASGVLDDCITVLRQSFRFGDDTQLGRLAQAINAGNADRTLALLNSQTPEATLDLRWADSIATLQRNIVDLAADHALQVIAARDIESAFAAFHRARVLCATREGPCGVETINHLVIARINQLMHWQRRRIFAGLPILILENDYENNLFNGDTGIVVEHEGQLAAAFETGADNGSTQSYRYLSLTRLPRWESAFAMTIHKSQGSEFDSVILVYPPMPLPLLTRELLYTGVTRSRERVVVFAQESVLRRSLQTTGVRQSGLAQLLQNARFDV
jgi:exodeoxyribonuclease V alpha subunit